MPNNAYNERAWCMWRYLYRCGLGVLFIPIAFIYGPRVLLFGKLTKLSPEDFVTTVNTRCVPVVQAIKRYKVDRGHLPADIDDLVPEYLPKAQQDGYITRDVYGYRSYEYSSFHPVINYFFDPIDEHWEVSSALVHGRIPLPPVTLSPQNQPIQPPK